MVKLTVIQNTKMRNDTAKMTRIRIRRRDTVAVRRRSRWYAMIASICGRIIGSVDLSSDVYGMRSCLTINQLI
jgi:hypothetical protein